MWICLNCGIEITDDEADNQRYESGFDVPCCCGGAMVQEDFIEKD